MANAVNLKFKGIHSDPNNLGSAPTGALSVADNVNIDREDIVEPRKGFNTYGNTLDAQAKKLFSFRGRLLVHHDETLSHDNTVVDIVSITSILEDNIISISSGTVTTADTTGLTAGDIVILTNTDSAIADGRWEITNITPTTFDLVGGPVPVAGAQGTWHKHLTTATVTTSEAHGLTAGQLVTVSGSDYVEYNVFNQEILSVPSSTTFTYAISNPTVSPATGDMVVEGGTWTDYTNTIDIIDISYNGSLMEITTLIPHELEASQQFTVSGTGIGTIDGNTYSATITAINKITFGVLTNEGTSDTGSITFTSKVVEPEANRKIRAIELSGNAYFTTNKGIKKLDSITGQLQPAGMPKGLNIKAELVDELGFFEQNNQVAYKAVWGRTDANNVLVLGTPGQAETLILDGLELFKKDFNGLLVALDEYGRNNPATVDTDHGSTLLLEDEDLEAEAVSKLQSLAAKLDKALSPGVTLFAASTLSKTGTASGTGTVTITSTSHGLSTGDIVLLQGFTAYPDINSYWKITNTGANTFTLDGSAVASISGTSGTWKKASGIEDTNPALVNTTTAHGLTNQDLVLMYSTTSGPTVDGVYAISVDQDVATHQFSLSGTNVLTSGTGSYAKATYSQYTYNVSEDLASIQEAYDFIIAQLNLDLGTSLGASTTSQVTQVTVQIPSGIIESDFLQLYRTKLSGSVDGVPLDEYYLCYEASPTRAEIIAGEMIIDDSTPESFLGAALYTNATQEGQAQTNDRPPFAKDMAIFKNSVFYANTATRHFTTVSLLGTATLGSYFPYLTGSVSASITASTPVVGQAKYELTNVDLSLLTTNEKITFTGFANAGNNGTFNIVEVSSDPEVSANNYLIVDNASAVNASGSGSMTIVGDSITIDSIEYKFQKSIPNRTLLTITAAVGSFSPADYVTLHSANDVRKYCVWFDKTGTDTPPSVSDAIYIRIDISGTSTKDDIANLIKSTLNNYADFTVYVKPSVGPSHPFVYIDNNVAGPCTASTENTSVISLSTPRPGADGEDLNNKYIYLSDDISQGVSVADTSKSIIRVLNNDETNLTIGLYISGVNDVPGQMKFERENITDPSFIITGTNSVAFSPDLTVGVTSDNESFGNRLYYSKYGQAEAVPELNYQDIGSKDLPIQRIVALRDSLFIFKKDGIYQATGADVTYLNISLFDSSVKLIGPETAVVGNNNVLCFSDQGVVAINDTGRTVISNPITNRLLPLYGASLKTLVENYAFSVFSETEGRLLVWLPEKSTDTASTQAYVYSTVTQAWTRYPISKTCGIVNPTDDKIYLGDSYDAVVEKERKNFNYRDQADYVQTRNVIDANVATPINISNITLGRPTVITTDSPHKLAAGDSIIINDTNSTPTVNGKYTVIKVLSSNKFAVKADRVTVVGTAGTVTKVTKKVQLDSVDDISIGDVIVQSYGLNVNRFNKLLARLDADPGINDSNYLSTLEVTTDEEIPLALENLAIKLNADAGTTSNYLVTSQSNLRPLQNEFNALVEVLNSDTGAIMDNYKYSNGRLLKEVRITAVDVINKTVDIAYDAELNIDECYIQKAIATQVEWVPQHAGDPSVYKQFSEVQAMFDELNVLTVTLGFKTELSPEIERVEMQGRGTSAWGLFEWGKRFWSLETASEDQRTLVPTEKQRCRLITPSVIHGNAYESFAMTGLAITIRPVSVRVNN